MNYRSHVFNLYVREICIKLKSITFKEIFKRFLERDKISKNT